MSKHILNEILCIAKSEGNKGNPAGYRLVSLVTELMEETKTDRQRENEKIKDQVLQLMKENHSYTVTEILVLYIENRCRIFTTSDEFGNIIRYVYNILSHQRMTQLVSQLVNEGKISRKQERQRPAMFCKV